MREIQPKFYEAGFGGIAVFLYLLAFFALLIGVDYAYIFYKDVCGNLGINSCMKQINSKDKTASGENAEKNGEVVTAAGTFTYNKYSVKINLDIPLGGGEVIGKFDGTCSGKVTGTYDGKDGGTISGNAHGSCSPFMVPIPASATYKGSVNQKQKTVPLNATGGAMGIKKSGSMVLNY